MLETFLSFLLISSVCITWGLPVAWFEKQKVNGASTFSFLDIVFSFFCGLVILAIVSSFLVFFLPLHFSLIIIPTVFLILFEIYYFKRATATKFRINFPGIKSLNYYQVAFLLLSILMFISLGSGKPTMQDSEIYHLQVIKSIHDYGTIKGFANLYIRYGMTSNWLSLISLFQFDFLPSRNYLGLNTTLSVWLFFFLFYKWKTNSSKNEKHAKALALFYLFCLLYMLFEWDLLRVNASSTSYDFIVTALTLICFAIVIEDVLMNQGVPHNRAILVLLSASIVSFKISALPVLLLLLIYFISKKISLRQYLKIAPVIIGFLLPVILRSYLQTGYLFFPFPYFDFFHPDWQVPRIMVEIYNQYVLLSNRYINLSIPPQAWRDTAISTWFPVWMKNLTINDKYFLLLSGAGFVTSFFIFFGKKTGLRNLRYVILAAFTIVLMWLLTAPDPRFAYGYLLIIAFLPASFLVSRFYRPGYINIVLTAFSIGIAVYNFQKIKDLSKNKNLVLSASITTPAYNRVYINGHEYNLPATRSDDSDIRCFDVSIPCIYQLNPYLEQRGKNIGDGFRMNATPDTAFFRHYIY